MQPAGCSLRVKICGITSVADAIAAAEVGADAIGLNFVGGPRRVSLQTARAILEVLPPLVTPVALVRADAAGLPRELLELFGAFRVAHLQVYGTAGGPPAGGANADELPAPPVWASLVAAGFRVLSVLAVKDAGFADRLAEWGRRPMQCRPCAVVLDAYDPDRAGGTGRTFCWDWVAQARSSGSTVWPPILLAGGLNPDNVAEAVRLVRPYGVDVSSGVECAGLPGRKDPEKIAAFVRNARTAMSTL